MLREPTKERALTKKTETRSVSPLPPPAIQLLCNDRLLERLPVDRVCLLIGRAKDNDMTVSSDYVSRYHVMLLRHSGSTILVDLQSTNGTFVNSERVDRLVLADGDEICVDRNSLFKQTSIRYSDPSAKSRTRVDNIKGLDALISKGMRKVGSLLGRDDTDLSPTLRENAALKMCCIDDR